jgi:hypothetical protein
MFTGFCDLHMELVIQADIDDGELFALEESASTDIGAHFRVQTLEGDIIAPVLWNVLVSVYTILHDLIIDDDICEVGVLWHPTPIQLGHLVNGQAHRFSQYGILHRSHVG